MNDDRDWHELTELWQQGPGPDLTGLARRVRRKSLRMRLFFALETLTSVAVIGVCLAALARDTSIATIVLISYGIALTLYALYASLQVRRGTWSASSQHPAALLDLEIRRSQAGLRLVKLNKMMVPIMGIPMLVFLIHWAQIHTMTDEKLYRALAAGGFVVIYLGAVAGFCAWYRRRICQRLAQLKELREALAADETAAETD